ncbi:MAG: sigma-70 family RNA polymerase sigma factor [Planctomycetota bacterium]|nr:MAG: sigma-70 family RNA polymerase sigma factor [Planctomycetota bacterium]
MPRRLADLLAEHGPALVLYARAWCDCPEDVVQDALVEMVSRSRPPDHVVAWLFRVVRNGAISAGRSARRRQQREQSCAARETWFDDAATAIDAAAATEALETLSPELREAVVARIWGQLTFDEIAKLTDTSSSTAQRRYEQGLRHLYTRLEKPCTTNPPSTPS